MQKRYAAIWFPYLLPNWWVRKHPHLADSAFVLATSVKGKMIVKAASQSAAQKGIHPNMVVADCKTIFPHLQVFPWNEEKPGELLKSLGEWCIRFSPVVAVDLPDGLIIDTTGCHHLWGGEEAYRKDILQKLNRLGYIIKVSIAGTIGAARAIARFGQSDFIIPSGTEKKALSPLPPAALLLADEVLDRLSKLGMHSIQSFINIPGSSLRRRFGHPFLECLQKALGFAEEFIEPIQPPTPYYQHLPCLEPVRTAIAIEIALQQLLEAVCMRLKKEEMGMRCCIFTVYRVDGHQQQ